MVYFNSHPHEEDDHNQQRFLISQNISTHILTRRMTKSIVRKRVDRYHFNSHPHEEDDIMLEIVDDTHIISTHILTRRMTEHGLIRAKNHRYFNSHPHEEDDPRSFSYQQHFCIFQLTSSRGG